MRVRSGMGIAAVSISEHESSSYSLFKDPFPKRRYDNQGLDELVYLFDLSDKTSSSSFEVAVMFERRVGLSLSRRMAVGLACLRPPCADFYERTFAHLPERKEKTLKRLEVCRNPGVSFLTSFPQQPVP